MHPASIPDLEILRLLAFGNEAEKMLAQDQFDLRFRPALEAQYNRKRIGRRDNSLHEELERAGLGTPDDAIREYIDYLLTGGRVWVSMQVSEGQASEVERGRFDLPLAKVLAAQPHSMKAYLRKSFWNHIQDVLDKLERRSKYNNLYEEWSTPEDGQYKLSPTELIPEEGSAFGATPTPYVDLDLRPDQPAGHVEALLVAVEALKEDAGKSATFPAQAEGIIADFCLRVRHAEESLDPTSELLTLPSHQRLALWVAVELGVDLRDAEQMKRLAELTVEGLLDEVIAASFGLDLRKPQNRELIQTRRRDALKAFQGKFRGLSEEELPDEQYRLLRKAQRSQHEDGATRSSGDTLPMDHPVGDPSHPPTSNPGLA
jgi:hypothetical protein